MEQANSVLVGTTNGVADHREESVLRVMYGCVRLRYGSVRLRYLALAVGCRCFVGRPVRGWAALPEFQRVNVELQDGLA